MTHVWHLVVNDLRHHWRLLAAWIGIVCAHPLVAAWPWTEDGLAAGSVLATLLVGARVVIGAAVIATVVQADSPIDDRSFWRTRPIAAQTMAAAKLALVVLVFVAVPLLVVSAVALAVGVPAYHWPVIVAAVLLGETPPAMLAATIAARTRQTSTALVGLAAVVGVVTLGITLAGMVVMYRRPEVKSFDPLQAPLLMLGWLTLSSMVLARVAWAGHRARTSLATVAAVAAVGLLAVWLTPVLARVSESRAAGVGAARLTRVQARQTTHGAVRVDAVVSHSAGPKASVFLNDVDLRLGPYHEHSPGMAAAGRSAPAERTFVVADLSTADAQARQGQPVAITGRVAIVDSPRTIEAAAALTPGARLEGRHVRGVVTQVHRPSEDVPVVADVALLSLDTALGLRPSARRLTLTLTSEDGASSRELYQSPRKTNALVALVQLPILTRPFATQRLSLRVQPDDLMTTTLGRAVLEIARVETRVAMTDVHGTFPMPALSGAVKP